MIRDPFAHASLSDQEGSVLRLAAEGLTDREIAKRMSVSEKTIDTYWSRIRQKLDARNRTHAVAIAFKDAYSDKQDPLYGCEDVVSNAEEGVWIIDLRGNTVYANEKLASMLGFSMDEMRKVNGWDLLDDEWRQEARKMVQEYPEGRRDSFKFKFRKKDGSDLWVLMTTAPIADQTGRQIRSVAMMSAIDGPASVSV